MFRRLDTITGLWLLRSMLAISVLLGAGNTMAVCQVTDYNSANVPLVPLSGKFSIGQEFPLGGTIHSQVVYGKPLAYSGIVCPLPSYTSVTFQLRGGTPYPGDTSGNLYKTGIDGVAVRFNSLTTGYPLFPFETNINNVINEAQLTGFRFDLVKLAPTAGGAVNTALFPKIAMSTYDRTDSISSMFRIYTITGSLTLQVPSCTTPNFNWNLGTTNTSLLAKVGDATPWIDTPVTLTNCSAFLGNKYKQYPSTYTVASGEMGNLNLGRNILTMTLKPNAAILDAANGIVSSDSSDSATGFGVQVASKKSGVYIPQNLSGSIVVEPVVGDTSGTVSFPLGARIIRTSSMVKAGKISTSLTYTINYQ